MKDISGKKFNKEEIKTIAGFLATALDLEEQVSGSIYRDYLDFKNWPVILEKDAFEVIKKHLTTLIYDTEEHIKIFSNLMDEDR